MIRPPGFTGAAFGTAGDGDARRHDMARETISQELGIPAEWAYVDQVHGHAVVQAQGPGNLGDADAIFTTAPRLPITIATADCVPIIVEGPGMAAVIHAGWRGLAAGVIEATLDVLAAADTEPKRAAIGAAIGPCCYEVGEDVAGRFGAFTSETTWGTTSVDLGAAAAARLGDLTVWRSDVCTSCGAGYHSYRSSGTEQRQVAVAWVAG